MSSTKNCVGKERAIFLWMRSSLLALEVQYGITDNTGVL